MPNTGSPYRVGANFFISENIKLSDGSFTTKQVPLSFDQVRQMNGVPALPEPPAYVEKSLAQKIQEGLAAGKTPADILPFGGRKPSEISESYEQRLARAERLENEIRRAQKTTAVPSYPEKPLGERIAAAISQGKRASDCKPFGDRQ